MDTMTRDDDTFESSEPAAFAPPAAPRRAPHRKPESQAGFLRVLLDNLSEGIVSCDADGHISFRNKALLEIGRCSEGQQVVIVAGSPPGIAGSTNALRIHNMGDAINRVSPAYHDPELDEDHLLGDALA